MPDASDRHGPLLPLNLKHCCYIASTFPLGSSPKTSLPRLWNFKSVPFQGPLLLILFPLHILEVPPAESLHSLFSPKCPNYDCPDNLLLTWSVEARDIKGVVTNCPSLTWVEITSAGRLWGQVCVTKEMCRSWVSLSVNTTQRSGYTHRGPETAVRLLQITSTSSCVIS